jgi:hypothetical protein
MDSIAIYLYGGQKLLQLTIIVEVIDDDISPKLLVTVRLQHFPHASPSHQLRPSAADTAAVL